MVRLSAHNETLVRQVLSPYPPLARSFGSNLNFSYSRLQEKTLNDSIHELIEREILYVYDHLFASRVMLPSENKVWCTESTAFAYCRFIRLDKILVPEQLVKKVQYLGNNPHKRCQPMVSKPWAPTTEWFLMHNRSSRLQRQFITYTSVPILSMVTLNV